MRQNTCGQGKKGFLLLFLTIVSVVGNLLVFMAIFMKGTGIIPSFHNNGTTVGIMSLAHTTLPVTRVTVRNKTRVLCWVPSLEKWLPDRVKAVNETWLRRCDGHLFFVETKGNHSADVISLGISDGRRHLAEKSMAAFTYLYHHHLHDRFDWFLKGDDDTFVVVENLRYLLEQYNASQPVYLGHLFKVLVKGGYMSGGASYVLSREALRILNEEGFQKNKCGVENENEDLVTGRCLHTLGVLPHNSIDVHGRAAFHPETPEKHIARPEVQPWLKEYDRFPGAVGRNCCSELTISFHHMGPDAIRVMDHLLYKLTVYGRLPDFSKLKGLFKSGVVPPLP